MRYRSGEKLLVGGCWLVVCSLFWLGCEWDHKGDTYTPGSSYCTPICESDSNCSAPTPKCNTGAGACVQCLIDGDCTGGGYCSGGRCVECLSDSHCTEAGKSGCNLVTKTCQCGSDFDCMDVDGRHSCRMGGCACTSDLGCGLEEACFGGLEAVWEDADQDKVMDKDEIIQSAVGGECAEVECETSGDCDGTEVCLFAGTPNNACGCDSDDDCTNPDRKISAAGFAVCAASGRCVECTEDADCVGVSPSGKCNTETMTCIQCTQDSHCAGINLAEKCDTDAGTCIYCDSDAQCSTAGEGGSCAGGECTCTADGQCTADPPGDLIWRCL